MKSEKNPVRSGLAAGGLVSAFVSVRFLSRLLVSILVLGLLFWFLPLARIADSVSKVSAWIWPFMLLVFLLGHAVTAFKWRLLLTVNSVQVSWPVLLRAHGAGLFANICLPSIVGGDVVRASMVVIDTRQLTEVAVASLADRLLDTLALVSISVAALWYLGGTSGGTSLGSNAILQYLLIGMLLIGLMGIAAFFIVQLAAVKAILPGKVNALIGKILISVKLMLSRPLLAASVFTISIFVQGVFILLNVLLAKSIGIDVALVVWFYAWPLAKLCALVPVSLAGIGVRDAALVGILLPFTSDSAAVVAQSLSWQAVMIGGGLISGLAVYLVRGRFAR